MIHLLTNLRVATKLFIPVTVLVITIVAILWIAQSGMDELRADTDNISNTLAVRQELGLAMVSNFNDAAIQEKALMIETDEEKAKEQLARFDQRMGAAVSAVDKLIAMSNTPQRAQLNKKLKESMLAYRDLALNSIGLALRHDRAAAIRLSLTDVLSARRAFVSEHDLLIARRDKEMSQTHAESIELGRRVLSRLYVFAGVGLSF